MATPNQESERKARQEFQRKIFLLISKEHEFDKVRAEIGQIRADLWLLNDKILNGEKE